MVDLHNLTQKYIIAFNAKDIDGVAAIMADDFCLTDPSVTGLRPRSKVIDYLQGLFESNICLKFEAKSILVDCNHSVIHFSLELDHGIYSGVDFIAWSEGKMTSMNAYLSLQAAKLNSL
jgi:hypothetical protein